MEATNNGQNYSEPLKIMVYQSKTHTCNLDLNSFSCEKKTLAVEQNQSQVPSFSNKPEMNFILILIAILTFIF